MGPPAPDFWAHTNDRLCFLVVVLERKAQATASGLRTVRSAAQTKIVARVLHTGHTIHRAIECTFRFSELVPNLHAVAYTFSQAR